MVAWLAFWVKSHRTETIFNIPTLEVFYCMVWFDSDEGGRQSKMAANSNFMPSPGQHIPASDDICSEEGYHVTSSKFQTGFEDLQKQKQLSHFFFKADDQKSINLLFYVMHEHQGSKCIDSCKFLHQVKRILLPHIRYM